VLGGTVLVLNALWCRDGYARNPGVPGVSYRASADRLVLRYKAFSIFGTWILIEARIYTIFASACLVLGTLSVLSTPDNLASYEWISFIARDTPTHGFVAGWVAFGKSTTGVLNQAWVDTVAIDTHLSVSAVIVALASHGLAGYLRVSNIPGGTHAHWAVVLYKALCSGATVTGVQTLSVDTRLPIRTIIIPGAPGLIRQLHGFALGISVRNPALPAGADHGAEGEAVDHGADGGHIAGGESQAGVLTPLVQTSSVVRTVTICVALWFWIRNNWSFFRRAGHQWVTNPAWWTHALGIMVLH